MTSRYRYRRFAAYAFTMLTLAACNTTPHVASDYDRGASFSSLRSFTLIERSHPGLLDPLAVQRTSDAIRTELAKKGFTYVTDPLKADFAVDFTVGGRDRLDRKSYLVFWGPGAGSSEVRLGQYQEGTLAIDVFDVRSRRPVWRGSAQKALSQSEIDDSTALIQQTVAAILANFPPT